MKPLYHVLLWAIIFAGCKKDIKEVNNGGTITVMGTIQAQGATTYMYSTHTIKNIDQYFALKSSTVNLDYYKGKNVILKGDKVPGYPVDGGPDYLEVMSIKVQ